MKAIWIGSFVVGIGAIYFLSTKVVWSRQEEFVLDHFRKLVGQIHEEVGS